MRHFTISWKRAKYQLLKFIGSKLSNDIIQPLSTTQYVYSTSIKRSIKKAFYIDKIHSTTDTRKLFSTFKTLLNPPPPPPATNLTTDTFASFFTDKVAAISKQLTEMPTTKPSLIKSATNSACRSPTASFSSFTPSLRAVCLNFSYVALLLHARWTLFLLIYSNPLLLL